MELIVSGTTRGLVLVRLCQGAAQQAHMVTSEYGAVCEFPRGESGHLCESSRFKESSGSEKQIGRELAL
jgi:hypothetical protein